MANITNLVRVWILLFSIKSYGLFSCESNIRSDVNKATYAYMIVKVSTKNTALPPKLIAYFKKKGFKHEVEADLTHKFVHLDFRNRIRNTKVKTSLFIKDIFNGKYKIISIEVNPVNPWD